MPSRKSPPAKRPGQSVQEWQRHTVLVGVRCSPELATRARDLAKASGHTLAEILQLGVVAVERMPPRPMTPAEDEAACRADAEYDRMRDRD